MPVKETLVLAVTKMVGGMCIAGMTTQPDPQSGLQWVRPVRDHAHVLLGDITTISGHVLKPFDVAELNLLSPRSIPPHTEDWTTDFVHIRPRIVRQLQGMSRASFLSRYQDAAPQQVLTSQQRSLCLIKPDWVKGEFWLDAYSGKFEARMTFSLNERQYSGAHGRGGFSVTDIRWRALGRSWLPEEGGWTEYDSGDIESRLGARDILLAIGLTRPYKGQCWVIIIGVHTVPDYQVEIDYDNL